MRDFLRVLGLARRHAAWILLALMSMVVVAGATVFAFNLVRPIYDKIMRPAPDTESVPELPAAGVVDLWWIDLDAAQVDMLRAAEPRREVPEPRPAISHDGRWVIFGRHSLGEGQVAQLQQVQLRY